MKKIYKLIPLLFTAIVLMGLYTACTKDTLPNSGKPRIMYIRVSEPLKSDSLIIGANQGNLIVIIGENLQDAQQIWFNDQRASLTPTYINSSSILVSVPTNIPAVVDDMLKVVFSNGDTLKYYFKVLVSEPIINNMTSEYVLAGGVATINGDFFYKPITVTFTGGVTGEVVSVENAKIIKVTVPVGAMPGQITIKTNFGETKSNFWFKDNRNIFISSDPFTGWWNESFVVKTDVGDGPAAINGNYIRVKKVIAGWSWLEVAGGPASAMGAISKNIPDEAILRPSDYNLKFEVNTMKPYTANVLKINLGLNSENTDEYRWLPPYDTKGEWQTVVIPFEEITASYEKTGSKLTVNPAGYWTRLLFHGPGELDCDMSFDNFRLVPKVIKK